MSAPPPVAAPPPLSLRRAFAALALLTALATVYALRNADADLWGHLRYGRLFVEGGGPHVADPFAYTSAGRAWSGHEYLAQVLLWLAYAAGGPAGLLVLKCLLGGATVWCVYAAVRLGSEGALAWAPVFILAAHTLGRWFLFRPQLFTFLLFAAFVLLLFRHLLGRRGHLWLLPPLLALWVNLHGGFLAGVGAVGLALLLRAAQSLRSDGLRPAPLWRATWPLGAALAGCIAASLLNPLGWRLWPYLLTELTCEVNRRYIEEWQPARFLAPDWSSRTLLAQFVLLAALGLLTRRRPDVAGLRPWQWAMSCLPLAVMASRSIRHVPIFTVWAAPVLSLLAQSALEACRDSVALRRLWYLAAGLLALPGLMTIQFVLARPAFAVATDGPVLGAKQPYGAAAFLRANDISGRLWCPLWWGSYLTWELHPAVLVSMDGRNVTLFSAEQVGENLSFYMDERPDLDAPLRSGSDFLLVPTDTPSLPQLRDDSRWALLYEDADAVLLVRADEAHADWLRRRRAGDLVVPAVSVPATFR
jgi:hypothetical protein